MRCKSWESVEKKKTYGYQERDPLKRQEFQVRLQTKTAAQIVYVDEAGIDNRDEYPWLLRDWRTLPRLQIEQTYRKSQLDCGAEAREGFCTDDLYRVVQP